MCLDDIARNGETQATTAKAGIPPSEETFENMRHLFRQYPLASVFNRHIHVIGDGSNVYLDLSDVIGILDRILNQVSKDMDDGFPIAIHLGISPDSRHITSSSLSRICACSRLTASVTAS